jgi:hypothetical protein
MEVANAMQRYMVAARAVNADEIAAFYTLTAVLFEPGINPIEGRETIRAFIAQNAGARRFLSRRPRRDRRSTGPEQQRDVKTLQRQHRQRRQAALQTGMVEFSK